MLTFPPSATLTQGTIFSGGVAEDYEGCKTYGLIITARCDAVNEKTRTYNYLPVVPLDEWINRDGASLLGERLRADLNNGMRNVLRASKLALSVLETEEPDRILATLFAAGDKKTAGPRAQFEGLCGKWHRVHAALAQNVAEAPFFHLAAADSKIAEQVVRDLVQHKVSGYYFLRSVEPEGDDLGYVVLLREVHHIHRAMAELLVRAGLARSDYEEMCRVHPNYRGRLNIVRDDVAMPVSMLTSPHVEHLLQVFSNLFGRIGVPDTPIDYLQELCARQPSFKRFST